jgi:plasmid stability protein
MGQILVRKIDDETIERLKKLAVERKTSVEALARQAIEREAQHKTGDELRDLRSEFENFSKSVPRGGVDSTILLRALRDGDEIDG